MRRHVVKIVIPGLQTAPKSTDREKYRRHGRKRERGHGGSPARTRRERTPASCKLKPASLYKRQKPPVGAPQAQRDGAALVMSVIKVTDRFGNLGGTADHRQRFVLKNLFGFGMNAVCFFIWGGAGRKRRSTAAFPKQQKRTETGALPGGPSLAQQCFFRALKRHFRHRAPTSGGTYEKNRDP